MKSERKAKWTAAIGAGFVWGMTLTAALTASGSMAAGTETAEHKGTVILDGYSYWRAQLQVSAPVIRYGGDKLQGHPAKLDPLPENWTSPDFDDTAWVRTPGPFFSGRYEAGFQGWESATPNLALICLRGRFSVSDPAKVESLKLDMTFRGGAVVYINGKEAARKYLPEGKIEPWTPAEDYPKEAYVRPDGEIIRHACGDPERLPDRLALRRRNLAVSLDTKLLRKGSNVIAIELHRAPYDEVATQKTKDGRLVPWGGKSYRAEELDKWATVGMTRFALTAVGDGIASARVRPKGFQVWNSDPVMPVYDTDFGDPGGFPLPVRIVGARNGRFHGILVAGSDQPIKGLKAAVSDLKAGKGGGIIPASAVLVRYQLPEEATPYGGGGVEGERVPGVGNIRGFDALAEEPPAEVPVRAKEKKGNYPVVFGAVCPIWFTVHVPRDAAVGRYEGKCRIEAEGATPVEVPLRVEVCSEWTLPEPQEFRTLTGFHQSPESVAMQYGVPMWSDEHFRLMGETFKRLGTVGCKTVFLHVIEQTNTGNERSLVRWVRKKGLEPATAAGFGDEKLPLVTHETHDPDFTALDRYLDVALEHLKKPPVICLYAWDNYCGTWYSGAENSSHNVKPHPVRITELADGKPQSAFGPSYVDVEKAAEFWKPVAEHTLAYLKVKELEKSLMVGLAHDSHPGGYVVETWKRILPSAPWAFEGHPRVGGLKSLSGNVPVGWCCTVWGARMAWPGNRNPGWKIAQMQNHFDRECWRSSMGQQLLATGYLAGEQNIAGAQRGFGRVNADGWPVLKDNRGRKIMISCDPAGDTRYRGSDWGACNIRMTAFLQPGPKGAISTGRLEMMREGLQECEARIFIEDALLDPAKLAKLGPELEKRCWDLLDRRIHALGNAGGRMGTLVFLGSGRQERSRELFTLAADVAAKITPQGNTRPGIRGNGRESDDASRSHAGLPRHLRRQPARRICATKPRRNEKNFSLYDG